MFLGTTLFIIGLVLASIIVLAIVLGRGTRTESTRYYNSRAARYRREA